MNVCVVPDAAMIVIPLIEKQGHSYISPTNFSRYDNMDIAEGNLALDNAIAPHMSSELPSGVRSRLFLFSKIVDKVDAAIIIGYPPKIYNRMYNSLNELILFGCNSCNNAHTLTVKIINELNIPTLKLAFPTTRDEIIFLIDKTNLFLKNLKSYSELDVDLMAKNENVRYPVEDVENIINYMKI